MTFLLRFKSWLLRVADYIHAMAGICPFCAADLEEVIDEGLIWRNCPACDYRRVIDEVDQDEL